MGCPVSLKGQNKHENCGIRDVYISITKSVKGKDGEQKALVLQELVGEQALLAGPWPLCQEGS